jgi:hypothetical protein
MEPDDHDAQLKAYLRLLETANAVLKLFAFKPNKLKKSTTLAELLQKWLALVSHAVVEPTPQEDGQAGSFMPRLNLTGREGDDSVKRALCQGAAVLLCKGDKGQILQVTVAGTVLPLRVCDHHLQTTS